MKLTWCITHLHFSSFRKSNNPPSLKSFYSFPHHHHDKKRQRKKERKRGKKVLFVASFIRQKWEMEDKFVGNEIEFNIKYIRRRR